MDLLKFLRKKKIDSFEELLKKAANEPAHRSEFIKRILTEKLVVITKDQSGPEGYSIVQKGTLIKILSLPDGSIPVFTSKDRIFDKGIIKKEVNVLECKGEDLFNLVKGTNLILNPYSDYGKKFTPEEVERILKGAYFDQNAQPITIKKATKVAIGQPAVYPTNMVKSLVKLFSNKREVVEAYIGWIYDPSSGDPPHYIIAIKMEGNWGNINQEAGYTAQQLLGADEIIDFIQISGKTGFLEDYFAKTKPFYSSVS